MNRSLLLAAIAVAVVAGPVRAGAPGPPRPAVEKFANAQIVVVGKVASIEKDAVAAEEFPGNPRKAKYTVAAVKIESNIFGTEKGKEIKVGFLPPVKRDPNMILSRYEPTPSLGEGQEVLLHLVKHPTADFYVMSVMPADVKNDWGKRELEIATRFAAVLADPVKALKADKAELRVEAAALLILKYRRVPESATAVEQVAIPAEENTLILKAILEGDWSARNGRLGIPGAPPDVVNPSALQVFQYLGLNAKDGWIEPVTLVAPGQPAPDYATVTKDAFAKWRAGPGKDYVFKKLVPKPKP